MSILTAETCETCRSKPARWRASRGRESWVVCNGCKAQARKNRRSEVSYVELDRRREPVPSVFTGQDLTKPADLPSLFDPMTPVTDPIVRTDDPWTSHVAAERIEPKRGTRKALVLAVLQAAAGEWVDGAALTRPEVGGSEGLRRLRELRTAHGWPIERRPNPASATAWQYRLEPR